MIHILTDLLSCAYSHCSGPVWDEVIQKHKSEPDQLWTQDLISANKAEQNSALVVLCWLQKEAWNFILRNIIGVKAIVMWAGIKTAGTELTCQNSSKFQQAHWVLFEALCHVCLEYCSLVSEALKFSTNNWTVDSSNIGTYWLRISWFFKILKLSLILFIEDYSTPIGALSFFYSNIYW